MAELSERERLYNEIYGTVKEHSVGMTRGEVQGVLVDIAGDIPSASARQPIDGLFDQYPFKEKTPRT